MLNRLRARRDDEGFTLIELLVVIIIIGILAAIAIPVFLNQRKKGWDAAVQSDLKNAATAEETYNTSNFYYTDDVTDLTNAAIGYKQSNVSNYFGGDYSTYVIKTYDAAGAVQTGSQAVGSYCISAQSASGSTWVYDSAAGGMQAVNATCP